MRLPPKLKRCRSRVRELESQLAESRRLIDVRNAELSELQRKLGTPAPAAAPPAAPSVAQQPAPAPAPVAVPPSAASAPTPVPTPVPTPRQEARRLGAGPIGVLDRLGGGKLVVAGRSHPRLACRPRACGTAGAVVKAL